MRSKLGHFTVLSPLREELSDGTLKHIESPLSYGQVVRRYDSRWKTGSAGAKYIVEWRRGQKVYCSNIIRLPDDLEK